ncbi:hypothetical protein BgAZ_108710 [Babesia gibsoni]|uniref:Uncharacterized protein n=1 Tax=Babesia gibsoni TaxID=33632 RepID=A0AAD8PGT3_BABGI|nr:hypothetical protein BgAZ_108710 [Babesia gibsoni]
MSHFNTTRQPEKRGQEVICAVDFTRFLDAACMTVFSILVSCAFLFMLGETLRMINRTSLAHKEYIKRFLNRMFPFRNSFDFNLTHALLFTLCMLLLSFRAELPPPQNATGTKNQ